MRKRKKRPEPKRIKLAGTWFTIEKTEHGVVAVPVSDPHWFIRLLEKTLEERGPDE